MVFAFGVGQGEWAWAVRQMRAATLKGGGGVCVDGAGAPTGGNSIVIRGTNVSLHLSFVDTLAAQEVL